MNIQLSIVPARGQVILTEPCNVKVTPLLSFLNHLYVKQTVNHNFYLGSHTEFVGFDSRITLEKITTYAKAFAEAVPLLARLQIMRCFTGFRPICKDDLPVIGPMPECPRLLIACGHGRTGVRYSASIGKTISELIVDGKTELLLDVFSPARFTQAPKQWIEVFVNGNPVRAYEGETIGAVLAAAGTRAARRAPQRQDSRGLCCCVGSCHGCLVTTDGLYDGSLH